jgi:hypothetical protein
MDVCVLWVLCVIRLRTVQWADHSSRGVLPNVVRRFVWSRNVKNEEAMASVGPQRPKKIKYLYTERGTYWVALSSLNGRVNGHVALYFVSLTMVPWLPKYVRDNVIQNIV